MDQLPRLGKRELICLLLFTCNYVVSVWRGFLFLWVPGMGYVILLWHSLSLPLIIFQMSCSVELFMKKHSITSEPGLPPTYSAKFLVIKPQNNLEYGISSLKMLARKARRPPFWIYLCLCHPKFMINVMTLILI